MNIALVVFAKVPDLGIAKSRIAAVEGAERAALIYDELLEAAAQTVAGCPHHIAFTGADTPGRLADIFPNAVSFFPQAGDTLGKRLENACTHLFKKNYAAVCSIGCDCPCMTGNTISQAFDALESKYDIVIGPALDGGYYLIGIKPGHEYVFSVDGWGGEYLLSNTLSAIKANNARYHMLERYRDIDTIQDYRQWKKSRGMRNEN
jgi:rSAM/selenodomain-associated transferase 1